MICKYCLQNYVFIRNHVIFGKLLYISRRISCLCEKTILMYLYLFCKGINKLFTKLSRRWVRPFPLSVRLLTSRHLEMSTWSKRKGKKNVNFTVEWLNNWAICFPLFTSLSLSLKGKISCYVFFFFLRETALPKSTTNSAGFISISNIAHAKYKLSQGTAAQLWKVPLGFCC